jgi:hypothetical protein
MSLGGAVRFEGEKRRLARARIVVLICALTVLYVPRLSYICPDCLMYALTVLYVPTFDSMSGCGAERLEGESGRLAR